MKFLKTYESPMMVEFSGLLKCVAKSEFFKRPTKMSKIDVLVGLFGKYQRRIPTSRR